MKKLLRLTILLPVLFACNKNLDCPGNCPFEYAETGNHGVNILAGSQDAIVGIGDFSFTVDKPANKSLKIRLELISGNVWFYVMGGEDGWDVSTYDESNGQQSFTLKGGGESDLHFNLAHSPDPSVVGGQFYIHYYENSSEISRTRKIIWG
jgi:hypothetical protein